MNKYNITLAEVDGEGREMQVPFENHDDIFHIVERTGHHFDNEGDAQQFALGLKLLGGVLMKHRDMELFSELEPAFKAFMMKLKGKAGGHNAVVECILGRTSVRSFQVRPVEDEKVEAMLRAAMAAPSGVNAQPWHFNVVTDKTLLAALAETNPYAKFIARAPLAIVVSGDMSKAHEVYTDLWIQDCAAATENLLVAAHAMGLGAVWTSSFPEQDRVDGVKRVLSLPEHLTPFCIVPVGYPTAPAHPRDKWNESNITRNA